MLVSMQGTSNQPHRSAPPSHTHASNTSQAQELPPHNTVALPGQLHTSSHVLPQSPLVRHNSIHDLHNISDDFLWSWAAAAGPLIQPLQDIEKAFHPWPKILNPFSHPYSPTLYIFPPTPPSKQILSSDTALYAVLFFSHIFSSTVPLFVCRIINIIPNICFFKKKWRYKDLF